MSDLSNYLENAWVNHVLRNTAYTSPGTSIYVALHSADPTDAGSGAELSGSSYARVQVSSWDAPSTRSTQNTSTITFPTASGNWTAATHVGIWDASTAGNLLFAKALGSTITVLSGGVASFAAGDLDIALTGAWSTYLGNALLSHTLRNSAYTTPGTSIYLALHTADPTVAGNGTEVSGSNYSRTQVSTWDAPSNGATANTSAIASATASGSWGAITHIGLRDASTTGNQLFFGALSGTVNVGTGGKFNVAAGDIDIVLA